MSDFETSYHALHLKLGQLESEIHKSDASAAQRSNMLHTLSKAAIFAGDMLNAGRSEAAKARVQLAHDVLQGSVPCSTQAPHEGEQEKKGQGA